MRVTQVLPFLLAATFLLLARVPCWAADNGTLSLPSVLVLDLRVERGIDPSLASVLSEVTLSTLSDTGLFRVIGERDVRSSLEQEQQRQIAGCNATDCLAEIGAAFGAEYLAETSLTRVGDEFILSGKLIGRAGEVTRRFTRRLPAREEQLVSILRHEVQRLAGLEPPSVVAPADHRGSLLNVGPWAWVAASTAVVAGAFGGYFAIAAKNSAPASRLDPEFEAKLDDSRRDARIANVGFGVAAVSVAAFVLTTWLSSSPDMSGPERAWVFPTSSSLDTGMAWTF